MSEGRERIAENLASVRDRIAEAARQSGRAAADVRLVGVTKYVTAEQARELVAAGCFDLGESRPQELWQKAAHLAELAVHWHLIGHLQTNKLKRTLPLITLLHSLDSEHLAEAIEQWAATHDQPVAALLEVNISGDATKHGFSPETVTAAVEHAYLWPHVQLRGLMAMASQSGGRSEARRNFIALRKLRDDILDRFPEGPALRELSMGMSQDFDIAVEEGATIVRVGSALFEGLDP